MTTPGAGVPDGAFVLGSAYGSDITETSAKQIMKSGTVGSFTRAQNAHKSQVKIPLDEQLAVINDHSQSINAIEAKLDALILQGNAIKFVGNSTYYPSAGIVSVEVISIGAGGGGGGGQWNVIAANRGPAAGGGGGGEIHAKIPGNLLPASVDIVIGAGGVGGTTSEAPGNGGGNTRFGDILIAGGGSGGQGGYGGQGGAGGSGMVPGGKGGNAGGNSDSGLVSTSGGNSASAYDLYGGGGGGGAGAPGANGNRFPTPGGGGVASLGGQPGFDAVPPSNVLAVGGGGGGGAAVSGGAGGAGAFPGGGGGGGAGGGAPATHGTGGQGANAVLYVIERFS